MFILYLNESVILPSSENPHGVYYVLDRFAVHLIPGTTPPYTNVEDGGPEITQLA